MRHYCYGLPPKAFLVTSPLSRKSPRLIAIPNPSDAILDPIYYCLPEWAPLTVLPLPFPTAPSPPPGSLATITK